METLLENVVGLRQMLEGAADAPCAPEQETEPTLPAPDTLQAQFNHRSRPVSLDAALQAAGTLCLRGQTNSQS